MIPIQNIYYMLSYAFRVLQEEGYKNLETESYKNTGDLFAAILERGISLQLKRGLHREYVVTSDSISSLRGKIELSESLKTQSILKRKLVCSFDDFSVNNQLNQILKSTVMLLLKADVTKHRKKELRRLMIFFRDVDYIDLHQVNWNIHYNSNNQTYRMLISICYLAVKGLLQTNQEGSMKLMDYLDEQRMCRLYERFILEYYRKEHRELTANASQIPWQVDDTYTDMLPVMQTDIMLTFHERILIIDAKYYGHITQQQYGANTIHSGNLYQIFTYVKNKEYELKDQPHQVSGMLLYAKTDEQIHPDQEYRMSGNKISVRTLDLNCDFTEIRTQLDRIVEQNLKL